MNSKKIADLPDLFPMFSACLGNILDTRRLSAPSGWWFLRHTITVFFFEVSGHLTHKNDSQKPNGRSARVFIYCGVFVTERRASVIKQT